MKKIKAALALVALSFSFFDGSTSHSSMDVSRNKLNSDGKYNSVCVNGRLDYQSGKNFLPRGFYGNYPDTGVVEIGGKAGDIYGESIPTLTWNSSGRFMASVSFSEDIIRSSDADFIGRVGYEISITVPDVGDVSIDVRTDAKHFSDIFTYSESTGNHIYNPKLADNPINPVMTYWPEADSLLVTFSMKEGYEFNYLRITYGDVPILITNAAIFSEVADPTSVMSEEYTANDCTRSLYTVDVGNSPVYDLVSQYGTCYSKNFFLDSFVYRDVHDGETCHVEIIEDPDNYFNEGATADIGSRFTIYLVAYDEAKNRSVVTINLVVEDRRAPTITMLDDDIRTSYTEILDTDSFIRSHFLISDNYDEDVKADIHLSSGSPIPTYQTGTYRCLIEAADVFGNRSSLEFGLELYDDVPPEISCQQTELVLSPEKHMSQAAILRLFTAYDEIDGEIDVRVIADSYTGHEGEIGVYEIAVEAIDSSQNRSTATITILVQDDEGPIFFAKESFITVTEGNVPSLDEIVESLIRQAVIPNRVYTEKTIIEGEQLDDSLSVGLHQMRLYLKSDDGEEQMVLLTIKVVEESDLEVSQQKSSIWQRIVQFFVDLWNKIVSFFTGGTD